ncbi:neuronal acetylcholine receptor subunit alpha-10-like [Haliotis asinina]|uniref:neuronal acetylcholine receptor subunit alpha-10-like n=1 Tax=Haliotis asinina TaxID=109174 RepID=UPI003531ACC5
MYLKMLFLLAGGLLVSASSGNKRRLLADLFRSYNKRIEPFEDNAPLHVKIELNLIEITDIDEKKQVMTTHAWVRLIWRDATLAWQPEDYAGVTDLRIPSDMIWTPDVRVQNTVELNDQLSPNGQTNAVLFSNGEVLLVYQAILKTSCRVDLSQFPLDQQMCRIMFHSWSYSGDQLNITNEGGSGDLQDYISNAEWELMTYNKSQSTIFYACCPEPYITVNFDVVLRRRPLYFLVNVMMPCLVVTLVALLGLLVPNESGEKITIGMTSLLAVIVLLLVSSQSTPPTSYVTPLIVVYYAINIVIVSLSVGLAVFTLNIHHRGARGHKLPRLVKSLCFGFLAKILLIHVDLPESAQLKMITNPANQEAMNAYKPAATPTEGEPGGENKVVDVLNRLLHTVEKAMDLHKRRITTQDSLDEAAYEWKQLAIVLERALTIIFLIVVLCTTIAMFS